MKPRPGFVPPATAVPSCPAAAAPLAFSLLLSPCSALPSVAASADFCPWLAGSRAARRLRRQLRSRLRRLPQGWLARVARLHPGRPKALVGAARGLSSAAHPWLTLNRGAALPRLSARSLAGCAGQSVGRCRPTTTDFCCCRLPLCPECQSPIACIVEYFRRLTL